MDIIKVQFKENVFWKSKDKKIPKNEEDECIECATSKRHNTSYMNVCLIPGIKSRNS